MSVRKKIVEHFSQPDATTDIHELAVKFGTSEIYIYKSIRYLAAAGVLNIEKHKGIYLRITTSKAQAA